MAIPLWIKEGFEKPGLEKALAAFSASGSVEGKLLFAEHHQSHAATAFFALRGGGGALHGRGGGMGHHIGVASAGQSIEQRCADLKFPHSLGLLYWAFTYYTGFKVNSGRIQGYGARALR